MKNIIKSIFTGFCFGIGLMLAVFAAYKSEIFEDNSATKIADENIAKSVKSVLNDLGKTATDNCAGIEGAWDGQREEENGGIRTWHQQYLPDGVFNGRVTYTSVDSSSTDKQVGTWECVNSVLFTTIQLENRKQMYSYLILTSDDNSKILSYISRHKYPRTYLYKKAQP